MKKDSLHDYARVFAAILCSKPACKHRFRCKPHDSFIGIASCQLNLPIDKESRIVFSLTSVACRFEISFPVQLTTDGKSWRTYADSASKKGSGQSFVRGRNRSGLVAQAE